MSLHSDSLFQRGPSPTVRVITLAVVSMVLMVLDHRMQHLEHLRATLSVVVYPIHYLADLPGSVSEWSKHVLSERTTLVEENSQLRESQLLLKGRLQRMQALEAENARLRELLRSSSKAGERVLIAELLSVDLDPFKQQFTVNKGTRDGTYMGQALLDAEGVMGQLIHTGPFSSTAMLISDPSHAIPVQFNRTGVRTIALGTGTLNQLELPHLPNNVDVRPGDLLVSSGLGGRFPPGYPVAEVDGVDTDPTGSFARITARPLARLDRAREVLLVWNKSATEEVEAAADGPSDSSAPDVSSADTADSANPDTEKPSDTARET
ncbi:MAG: rod shape-determining protein MreC, partial [Gammaproteobacteria bacterium]